MLQIYSASVSELPDPLVCPSIMEGIGRGRKEKTLRFRGEKDRKLSLGAGLLLREILSRHGRRVEEIYQGGHGKPLMEGFCFNLSHSNDRVLLAAADRDVGCDIEKVTRRSSGVAKRFFSPAEREYWSSFPEGEERDRVFFRIWTARESYIKMTGEGMSLPFSCFEVRLWEKGNSIIYREGERQSCFLWECALGEYQTAVCVMDGDSFRGEMEIVFEENIKILR